MSWRIDETTADASLIQLAQRPPSIPENERRDRIRQLLQGFPLWLQNVRTKHDNEPRFFYRTQNGFHSNVDRLWAPPQHCVKSLGRANEIGQSVLYVTDVDWLSCLLEIVERQEPEREKELTIIVYEQTAPFRVLPFGIVDFDRYHSLIRDNVPIDRISLFERCAKFINAEFRRFRGDGLDYLNSSIFASELISENPEAAGIRYRTVQRYGFSHEGMNYALDPMRAKCFLKPQSVTKVVYRWIDSDSGKWYNIRSSAGTINTDGSIDYAPFTESPGRKPQ
jgi:hypothetical protein